VSLLLSPRDQTVEDKVLDLRPEQTRLVPAPFQPRPLMFYPIFLKIIVKLPNPLPVLLLLSSRDQMVEDKVLDLRPKQIRLVPPPFQNRPRMFHPMFRKIVVKLYSYFVSAQFKFRPIVLDWMIVVFGTYYDLNRGIVDSCRVDCDAEQRLCVGGPSRPGEWGYEGGSAWCAD